ncbi:MAG: zinc-binding dehydrogenase [Myxococcales bacterium]
MGHLFGEGEVLQRGLDTPVRLIDEDVIRPQLDQVFRFSRAAEAHQRIENRANVGSCAAAADRLSSPPAGDTSGARRCLLR